MQFGMLSRILQGTCTYITWDDVNVDTSTLREGALLEVSGRLKSIVKHRILGLGERVRGSKKRVDRS